jgi:hypothetical protein
MLAAGVVAERFQLQAGKQSPVAKLNSPTHAQKLKCPSLLFPSTILPSSLQYSQSHSTMPSRGNPNVPSKLKRKANRSKVQKRNAGKVTKKNARGTPTSSVLHPTGGPAAPLSGKKARKVEKAINHARRRALEAAMVKEGEVVMTGL